MKAKLFDRILLAILLIAVIALCISLILVCVRFIPSNGIQALVEALYYDDLFCITVGAAAALFLIVAVRLLFAGGAGEKRTKDEPVQSSTLVKATDLGSTFIAITALDAMVQKHCRANNHIRAVTSSVHAVREGGGITVNLKLSLMPESCIPELTADLQKSLKEYIETLSGITVREIGILVEDTSANPKARVD